MHNKNIALIAVGFGIAFLFFIDIFISKDTENELLKTIRDNNQIIGLLCLIAAYYFYTQKHPEKEIAPIFSETLETSVPIGKPELSSETMSTEDILNM